MLRKIDEEYERLLNAEERPIRLNASVPCNIKWQKAVNDLMLSDGLLRISTDNNLKQRLNYPEETTFFDWVIVSSYFSIFHSAQSLLAIKRIKIGSRKHYATLVSFAKHFIVSNELEEELFLIYEDSEKKAKELLGIFEEEKYKRGIFQYQRLSKSNLGPAKESLENAKTFLDAIGKILAKKNII